MAVTIHEGDTLVILVTVTDKATGTAKDITGATLAAEAREDKPRATDVAGVTAITDAAAGEFTITFSAGSLARGHHTLQSRATIGTETQVVADAKIIVEPAHL